MYRPRQPSRRGGTDVDREYEDGVSYVSGDGVTMATPRSMGLEQTTAYTPG